jgi:hypothetical protein
MSAIGDAVICVQSEWDGWKTAEVRLRDLTDIHWSQPSGAPRPLAHGYVLCTDIIDGEVAHRCDRAAVPHRLRVCVLKSHSAPSVYAEIARRANERCDARQMPIAAQAPSAPPPRL